MCIETDSVKLPQWTNVTQSCRLMFHQLYSDEDNHKSITVKINSKTLQITALPVAVTNKCPGALNAVF